MSDPSKRLEDELAEFLYTGIAEFSGIENGNFPLARKILVLPSLREIIEKAEKWDKLFEGLKRLKGKKKHIKRQRKRKLVNIE